VAATRERENSTTKMRAKKIELLNIYIAFKIGIFASSTINGSEKNKHAKQQEKVNERAFHLRGSEKWSNNE
jgi:hypothetical protein